MFCFRGYWGEEEETGRGEEEKENVREELAGRGKHIPCLLSPFL